MTENKLNVAIVGATGYGGLELLRLLYNHPNVNVSSIHHTSESQDDISQLFPHLKKMYKITFSPFNPNNIMQTADLVFFATSSGVSKNLAEPFIVANFPVIDLSGDFRLSASDYETWYHTQPAKSALLNQASYSLADFYNNSKIYIANPGCYATATLLALAPLAMLDLLDVNSIVVDAKSGLSGSGKSLTTTSHFINVNENFSMYKVNQHQHIPEITQQLKKWQSNIQNIQFTTSLLPINRGIFVSAYIKLTKNLSEKAIHDIYLNTYHDKQFLRVMPLETMPNIKQVVGTNFTDIGISYNPNTKYLTIVSVLDNMIKGAAGQAIQNMNHLFNLEESAGLNMLAQYA